MLLLRLVCDLLISFRLVFAEFLSITSVLELLDIGKRSSIATALFHRLSHSMQLYQHDAGGFNVELPIDYFLHDFRSFGNPRRVLKALTSPSAALSAAAFGYTDRKQSKTYTFVNETVWVVCSLFRVAVLPSVHPSSLMLKLCLCPWPE